MPFANGWGHLLRGDRIIPCSGKTPAKWLSTFSKIALLCAERTIAFKETLFSSTLPPYVLDAVSANLAILRVSHGVAP